MTKNAQHFSLVEALVALVLVGMAGTVILKSLTTALDLSTQARQRDLASSFAQQKIEEVYAADNISTLDPEGQGSDRFKGFEWRRSFEDASVNPDHLARVRVAVQWEDGSDETTKEVQLATVVRKHSE